MPDRFRTAGSSGSKRYSDRSSSRCSRGCGPELGNDERARAEKAWTATMLLDSIGLGTTEGGARRLMSEFNLSSVPGRGTTVTAVRWR